MNSCRLSFISLLFRLFWLFITFHFISFQPKGNISAKEFFIFYFSFSSPLFRSPSLPSSSLVLLFFSFAFAFPVLSLFRKCWGIGLFFFSPCIFRPKKRWHHEKPATDGCGWESGSGFSARSWVLCDDRAASIEGLQDHSYGNKLLVSLGSRIQLRIRVEAVFGESLADGSCPWLYLTCKAS